MSAYVTIWNPNSTPVQVSADGLQAPGLSSMVLDASEPFAKKAIDGGLLVVLSGAVEAPQPATVVEVELPAEPAAVEEAVAEATPEPAQESEAAPEVVEEEPKAPKSTRSKSQTASKES